MYGPGAVGLGEWYVYDSVSGVDGGGAEGTWLEVEATFSSESEWSDIVVAGRDASVPKVLFTRYLVCISIIGLGGALILFPNHCHDRVRLPIEQEGA